MRRLASLFLLFPLACTTAPPPAPVSAPPATAAAPGNPGLAILNASLWVQNAAEYRAVTMQTWAAARRALDEALADPTRVGALEETNADPSQPPAIILDLDETILDNTPFEARMIQSGRIYDEPAWKQWVAEGAAPATPGAGEFLTWVKSRRVTVVKEVVSVGFAQIESFPREGKWLVNGRAFYPESSRGPLQLDGAAHIAGAR